MKRLILMASLIFSSPAFCAEWREYCGEESSCVKKVRLGDDDVFADVILSKGPFDEVLVLSVSTNSSITVKPGVSLRGDEGQELWNAPFTSCSDGQCQASGVIFNDVLSKGMAFSLVNGEGNVVPFSGFSYGN